MISHLTRGRSQTSGMGGRASRGWSELGTAIKHWVHFCFRETLPLLVGLARFAEPPETKQSVESVIGPQQLSWGVNCVALKTERQGMSKDHRLLLYCMYFQTAARDGVQLEPEITQQWASMGDQMWVLDSPVP